MEGYITTHGGKGEQQKQIIMGPLHATVIVPPSERSPGIVDVVVTANEKCWKSWSRDTHFNIQEFLEYTPSEFLGFKVPKALTQVKTSDYVGRLDVERIIVAVNMLWNWDRTEGALTQVSVPILHDIWSEEAFPFTEERKISLEKREIIYKKRKCLDMPELEK